MQIPWLKEIIQNQVFFTFTILRRIYTMTSSNGMIDEKTGIDPLPMYNLKMSELVQSILEAVQHICKSWYTKQVMFVWSNLVFLYA